MSILAVVFIGKLNEPLYFYSKEDASHYINLQMIAHSALDVVEEKKKRASLISSFDLFLGILFSVEDYRVFGSYTNTHEKLICICDDSSSEAGIKEAMTALGAAFVNCFQNPFQSIGSPFTSKKLDSIVQQIITKQNSVSKRR